MTNNPGKIALFGILLFIGAYAAGYYGRVMPSTQTVARPDPAPSHPVLFMCHSGQIAAAFTERSVSLALSDGRSFDLPQTISGSGARYANTDESMVFWNKGNGAFVQEEGDMITYADCIEAKSAAWDEVLQVRAIEMLEDSRCPANANCVWAGRVRVRVTVTADGKTETVELALGEPKQVRGKTITLASVLPQKTTKELRFEDYSFSFDVR